MRPNFEEFLDTAKQLVEKNKTVYCTPFGEFWKEYMIQSPLTEYQKLGENLLISKNWDHYRNITKGSFQKRAFWQHKES